MRDWIKKVAPSLDASGIIFTELHRPWDQLIWPHAKVGFFKLKKEISNILNGAGLLWNSEVRNFFWDFWLLKQILNLFKIRKLALRKNDLKKLVPFSENEFLKKQG